MQGLIEKIDEAAAAIRKRYGERPMAGMILGTGSGRIAEAIENRVVIPFAEIPHFPQATATGHAGELVCGHLSGTSVVALQGRLHLYEGYSAEQVAFGVRVIRALGSQVLLLTNAAGGLDPDMKVGEVVVLDDHINLMQRNPLVGWNDDRLGPRFPDMSAPYDGQLIDAACKAALRAGVAIRRGVYVASLGPNYETRAEYRFLRAIGGDVVGMSTVPEVLAAIHGGIRVLALSVVTNVCLPDALGTTSGDEVVAAGGDAAELVRQILCGVLEALERLTQRELDRDSRQSRAVESG